MAKLKTGASRFKQMAFFKRTKSDYGGDLQKTRAGRAHGRPLSKKSTMHLVLRSTKARGERSLLRAENKVLIQMTLAKFAKKYGVRILSLANVGNHLHLQMRITNRATYNAFIRAVTGAIAMGVMRRSRRDRSRYRAVRGNPPKKVRVSDGSRDREDLVEEFPRSIAASSSRKFWDYRPFSRIAESFREYLNLKDYVRLNQLEGDGYGRAAARDMVFAESVLSGQRHFRVT